MNPSAEQRKRIWIGVALVALTLLAFWPVFRCEFVNYDDPEYVTQNSMVKAGLSIEGFRWAWVTNHAGNWHPFTWLSHMLDCEIYGLNPVGHHATNLLLHLANSLLLLAILFRLTSATWRCAFVAAMFALHPTHVESVAWVSERKDVLSTFFGFISTLFYIRFVRAKEHDGNTVVGSRAPLHYFLALLFFAFSLLSKGMLVTLPFVWLLLDWWPLQRLSRAAGKNLTQGPAWRRLVLEKIPFVALSLLVSAVTYLVQLKMTAGPGLVSRLYYLAIPVTGYFRYIGKLLFPTKLAAFYPIPATYDFLVVGVLALVLIGLSVFIFLRARAYPWLMVGWFWFIGTLVPVIGFVKVGYQSIADRYTYIPSIGFFIMIAWGLCHLLQRFRFHRQMLAIGGAAAVIVAGAVTLKQVSYWENGEKLFSHALAVTERNFVAHFSIAYLRQQKGNFAEAEAHYQLALEINPAYPEANCNYGSLLAELGRFDDAIKHYTAALHTRAGYAEAYNNLGDALVRKGQAEEAISEFQAAIRSDPELGEAYCNLGGTLVLLGRHDEALAPCREAVRLIPDDHRTHYNLGCALIALGRSREAIQCFRETIRRKADFPKALNELAWILATDPDHTLRNGGEAVKWAERACELTDYEAAPFLGTLDAAYAEAGRFDKAIATAEKARDLALAQEQPDLFIMAKKRLKLYEQKKPFRSEVDRQ